MEYTVITTDANSIIVTSIHVNGALSTSYRGPDDAGSDECDRVGNVDEPPINMVRAGAAIVSSTLADEHSDNEGQQHTSSW
jgi:hypothetical protein